MYYYTRDKDLEESSRPSLEWVNSRQLKQLMPSAQVVNSTLSMGVRRNLFEGQNILVG